MTRKAVKLTRGKATLGDMSAALDKLNVETGDDFYVATGRRQLGLEEDAKGPHSKDGTSKAAAINIAPKSGTQRRLVLEAIAQAPTTREQLEAITGLSGNAIRPRCKELEDGGFIRVTDQTRPTASGEQAEVLEATRRGKEALAD